MLSERSIAGDSQECILLSTVLVSSMHAHCIEIYFFTLGMCANSRMHIDDCRIVPEWTYVNVILWRTVRVEYRISFHKYDALV